MTYTLDSPLRDLIDLPRRVEAADFVIKLNEGVVRYEQTVRDYVVTDGIAEALGEGLDLVAGSLSRQSSRGAFLDGSFGSGKSHYMAVLHLLLSGDLNARQILGLEAVIADRQDLLERRLLILDYNLLGAKSFEDALFGGYLSTIAARHPESAAPVLHVSDGLLADARALREKMGDEAFFDGLGGGDSAWGDLGGAWDAQTFESAASAGPADADRVRLIGDLVNAYFSASVRSGEWLPMADGLRAITTHAKGLGYQGLVFLIDEIVLWLGQHLADQAWVHNEIEKVVQLAEDTAANLPIPITSFLARQRDLRDFLGVHVAGAERTAQGQLFAYWEERFDKIRLQAADLPKIVKRRLLQPVDGDAAYTLSAAVADIKQDHAAWGYLLSDDANSDEKAFADVYPFSPALVDTMVALSSLMQRERTALKLMAELLSDSRDTLRVRDVIPVGDLYEPIVLGGSSPLTEDMRKHFAISAQFYRTKMRPYLLRKHGVTDGQAGGLERNHPFVTEDRLAKTVLIAALAPEARSLSNLTAAKLAALNWGTISAFIAGNEAVQVLGIVREWASEFGEISIGDGHDPIVTATLSGVDYDSILERVSTEDNAQTRRELVRRLIAEELGLATASVNLVGLPLSHVWRGNKRTVTVKFGNVRDDSEVLDSDLFHGDDQWRVIIDFPYDSGNYSPAYDIARMQKMRDQGRSANTIAWIPNFLSDARQEDLGKLVLLDYLLTGSRFDANADHLPLADRGLAKQTLESRRRTLREVIISALRQAYGVNAPDDSNVGTDLDGNQIFAPLTDGLTIAPPPTGTLRTGLFHALDVAWANEFPNHPDLGVEEVTSRRLGEAIEIVTRVIEAGGRRQGLSKPEQRLAHDVVMPLRLGVLNENVLVIDATHFGWNSEFARWAGELAGEMTVGALRTKLRGWGMTAAMENTVLLTWAALGNWEFIGIDHPGVQALPDAAAVRRANLPADADFTLAQARAAGVFGVHGETHLTPRAVARFAASTKDAIRSSAIADLVQQLESHAAVLGLADDAAGRMATARRVNDLVAKLGQTRTDKELVEVLATFDLPDELTALGRTFATAERLVGELQGLDWGMVAAAQARADAGFEASLTELRTTAALNESVAPLEPRLKALSAQARALIVESATTPAVVPGPGPAPAPVIPPEQGREIGVSGTLSVPLTDLDEMLAKLKSDISATHASTGTVTITWQVE